MVPEEVQKRSRERPGSSVDSTLDPGVSWGGPGEDPGNAQGGPIGAPREVQGNDFRTFKIKKGYLKASGASGAFLRPMEGGILGSPSGFCS